MTKPEVTPIRARLRAAMTQAMKERDREAMSVYRSALAAIDNAEAVPIDVRSGAETAAGALEDSAYGLGQADVPRRTLTEQDMVGIVTAEVGELRTAADQFAGSPAAEKLLRQADLVQNVLDSA